MSDEEYDFELQADEDGEVDLPEQFKGEDVIIRQKGNTMVHRGRSLQVYSTDQNDHLAKNEDYFEVEISIYGEDKTYLVKAEMPEEKSEELQDKLEIEEASN